MERPTPDVVLDVRTLAGPYQHVRVQRAFDRLEPGESLWLLSDHHPASLLYGLMSRNRVKVDGSENTIRKLPAGPYVARCTRSRSSERTC